jgi:hypothetical protein
MPLSGHSSNEICMSARKKFWPNIPVIEHTHSAKYEICRQVPRGRGFNLRIIFNLARVNWYECVPYILNYQMQFFNLHPGLSLIYKCFIGSRSSMNALILVKCKWVILTDPSGFWITVAIFFKFIKY